MTNTLPGEWTQLIQQLPSDDRQIEARLRDIDKLAGNEKRDLVRGLLRIIAGFAGACESSDGGPVSVVNEDNEMEPVVRDLFLELAQIVVGLIDLDAPASTFAELRASL